jgi:hypothetical protein
MLERVLVLFLCLLLPAAAQAQTRTLEPRGEYAKIDTRVAREAIEALSSGAPDRQARTVAAVTAAPQKYAPPVFYALSRALFEQDKKDEAAFWYYAGQLRARFDANRCADVSARQAVSLLNREYGGPINKHATQDLAKLEQLVERVVAWDRRTPHDYDHRWINLHGMGAILSAKEGAKPAPLSLPKSDWPAIADKTRQDYLSGLRKAMERMKQKGR